MNRRQLITRGIPVIATLAFWKTRASQSVVKEEPTETKRRTSDGIVRYTEVPPMWNEGYPEWRENRIFGYYMDYRGTELGRIVSVKESLYQSDPERIRKSAREVLDYERQRRMFERDQKLAGLTT